MILLAAVLAAATWAAAPPAAAQSGGGAFVAGSQPWTDSGCDASEPAVVAASDAAAQSDLYSAVTLAGVLGTDCVVLAGDRGDPRLPAAQQARLDSAGFYVYVVGGESAVPDSKLAGYDIAVRIAGKDRWRTDCTGEPAVVAASDAAAESDLYSAVTLAGALGTDCVVLAGDRKDPRLPAAQRARLDTAAAVFVVGGLKAVPAAKLAGRDIAARIAGADRWHTAADVGDRADGLIRTAARSSVRIAPPATTATGRTPEERVTHIQDWFARIGLGAPVPVKISSGACPGFAAACASGDTIHYTRSPAQLHGSLLAHEYAHVYQDAYSDLASLPAWVVEGFAEYIAHTYSPGDARTERELCGAPLGEDNDLSRMGPGQFSSSVYRAGELAFTELADQYGWAAVTDYWITPGTHQRRFHTAFGLLAESWEREFHQNACRLTMTLGWFDYDDEGRVHLSAPRGRDGENFDYPLDSVRLTPTIVWDTFLVNGRTVPTVLPSRHGSVVGSETAAAALKACGTRTVRIEVKIFGEWHPATAHLNYVRGSDVSLATLDASACFSD